MWRVGVLRFYVGRLLLQATCGVLLAFVIAVPVAEAANVNFGTASEFDADTVGRVSAVQIGTDKFVICYVDGSAGQCRVATVSGTTPTWGTEAQFVTDGVVVDSTVGVCKLATDKFAVVFNDDTDDDGKIIAGSVSTTTISYGSVVEFDGNGDAEWTKCTGIATDKVAIGYNDEANSDTAQTAVCTASGTTVTCGTEDEYSNGSTDYYSKWNTLTKLNTDKYLGVWRAEDNAAGDDSYMVVVNVSTTTTTPGTEATFDADTLQHLYACSPQDAGGSDADRFVVVYRDIDNTLIGAKAGTVSSTTVTLGNETDVNPSSGDGMWPGCTFTDATHFVVAYEDVAASENGKAAVCEVDWTTRAITCAADETFAAVQVGSSANGTDTEDRAIATINGFGSAPKIVVGYVEDGDGDDGMGIIGTLPFITQSDFRWRNDDGSETTATWKDAANTVITGIDLSSPLRLRLGTKETASSSASVTPRLEYSADATSCTDGTWTTVTGASAVWQLFNSSNFTDAAATTNQLISGTFVAGQILDTNNPATSAATISGSGTEHEWSIQAVSGANATYRLRVTNNGSTYNSYSNCAQVTLAGARLTQAVYRWFDNIGGAPDGINWTQATSAAQWSARERHGSLVFDDGINKMWLMGGLAGGTRRNDVWYSTDGATWTQATNAAQWSGRDYLTPFVFDDGTNKMWVLGSGLWRNDVWYSTDGATWTQATNAAQWSGRDRNTSLVFNDGTNKMWVIGGGDSGFNNDVWYSTNGATWTQATANAEWDFRASHASVVFNDGTNKMWVIGGFDGTATRRNDVWYSTNGATWTQATSAAQWNARHSHTSLVFNDGTNKMWVIGGSRLAGTSNDIWYSTNGSTWTQATANAAWIARSNHASVVYNSGTSKMWVMGGSGGGNDVWYSTDNYLKVSSSLAAQNVVATLSSAGEAFNLRLLLHVGNLDLSQSGQAFTLQYAGKGAGSCAAPSGTPSSYTDVTSSTLISYNDNPGVADGAALVASEEDPTHFNSGWESSWTQATANAQWAARYNMGSVVFNDGTNKMWVIGGLAGATPRNDVWYSTNGSTWTQATSAAPWEARYGVGSVVFDDGTNKMWVMGGNGVGGAKLNDVWYSTNGSTWTQATSAAQWGARGEFSATVFNDGTNKMWVMGGSTTGNRNDVWYSTNGSTWTQATSAAQWGARILLENLVFDDGTNKMWLMGGLGSATFNDVWYSTNGATWTRATSAAQWAQRYGLGGVVFNDGTNKMWMLGGNASSNFRNDVWYSTNGSTWTQAASAAQWAGRYIHAPLTFNDGINKMWVIGGINATVINDVWYAGAHGTAQTYEEENPFSNTQSAITAGQDGLWNFALIDNGAPTSTTYCFQAVKNTLDATAWTAATTAAQWRSRFFSSLVTFSDGANKMWLFGGYDTTNRRNDVWYSTNGATWTQATANAQWSAREWPGGIVFNDGTNKMWAIGGSGNGTVGRNDVWYSTNGSTWTQATTSAQFAGRFRHASTVFNDGTNKMWVVGGNRIDGVGLGNDVWYSTNGSTWTQATDAAQWAARQYHTAVAFNDGTNKMWVVAGRNAAVLRLNDVWYSTNGSTWTQATSAAPWAGREMPTLLTFNNGTNKMWLLGGTSSTANLNDVWYSTNGSTWTQATANANWAGRGGPLSTVFNDGTSNKMWVLAGGQATPSNDVWYSNVTVANLDTYSQYPEITTAGAAAASFTLNDYRWYVDSDNENVTDPWSSVSGIDIAENTAITPIPYANDPPASATELRLRVNFTVNTSDLAADERQFKLQYKEGTSGGCSSGSWSDVGAAGGGSIWRFASSSVTDGANISATKLTASDVAEEYAKSNPTATNHNSATEGQDIEYDFHIQNNGASDNTAYSFRVIESDDTVFDSYSSCPTLHTRPGTGNLLRHGNIFSNGTEYGFFWAD